MSGAGWVAADGVRISWYILTYQDLPRLQRTLARLRALYPESWVRVVSDGDPDPRIDAICERYSVACTKQERLFRVEHGGELVQRMLELFLSQDEADILIKIDPDTHVRSRFARMPHPTDMSVCGTVQSAEAGTERLVSIQGGCVIVPRHAARRLASSGLLMSDRLKPPALEWAVNPFSRARAASGLTSFDWTLGWACRQLGLASIEHPEVFSRYRPNLFDSLSRRTAAVVHPRFEIRQLARPIFYVPRRWAWRFLPR